MIFGEKRQAPFLISKVSLSHIYHIFVNSPILNHVMVAIPSSSKYTFSLISPVVCYRNYMRLIKHGQWSCIIDKSHLYSVIGKNGKYFTDIEIIP